MKRKTVLFVGFLLLIVACSPTAGLEDGIISTDHGNAVEVDEELVEYTNEPPPAILTIDGHSQTAGIGGFCWMVDADKGICADKVGVPTNPEPLVAGDTFLAEFKLPLERNPDSLALFTYPVPDEGALPKPQQEERWWPYNSGERHHLPPRQQPSIELSLQPGLHVFNLAATWSEFGDVSYGFLVYVSEAVERDTAAFAEDVGISLEEARRRLAYQDTIGLVQEQLLTELVDSFAGLWVEQQPIYAINIALTDGDAAALESTIGDEKWAEFVEIWPATYTLARLQSDQQSASRLVQELNIPVITVVDVIENRVEIIVANPERLQDELSEAGLELPESVIIQAMDLDGDMPNSNRGGLLTATTAGGQTIFLPRQAPTNVNMAALMEGDLLEVNGCLRIADDHYPNGFMIIWPYDADLQLGEGLIEVINGRGETVARVKERLRLGGGAMESPAAAARLQESMPDLPVEACPGPYWIAGELETLEAQQVADIYFEPFSSGDRILAWYVNQSRPSPESEEVIGELQIDEAGCLRVDEYLVIWPPGIYLREEPLRIIGTNLDEIAQVGDTIRLSGAERSPADFRYFENKVSCPGPYWGVNEVLAPPE